MGIHFNHDKIVCQKKKLILKNRKLFAVLLQKCSHLLMCFLKMGRLISPCKVNFKLIFFHKGTMVYCSNPRIRCKRLW